MNIFLGIVWELDSLLEILNFIFLVINGSPDLNTGSFLLMELTNQNDIAIICDFEVNNFCLDFLFELNVAIFIVIKS